MTTTCSFLLLFANILLVMAAAKNVVITGASRGIGLGLAKEFAIKGYSVFATCRTESPELAALNLNGGAIVKGVDVTTDVGVETLQASLKHVNTIDVLINNSGILRYSRSYEFNDVLTLFDVLGSSFFTCHLIDELVVQRRIVRFDGLCCNATTI